MGHWATPKISPWELGSASELHSSRVTFPAVPESLAQLFDVTYLQPKLKSGWDNWQ